MVYFFAAPAGAASNGEFSIECNFPGADNMSNDIPFRRQLTASELLLYTTPFAGKSIFDLELEIVADE